MWMGALKYRCTIGEGEEVADGAGFVDSSGKVDLEEVYDLESYSLPIHSTPVGFMMVFVELACSNLRDRIIFSGRCVCSEGHPHLNDTFLICPTEVSYLESPSNSPLDHG